MSFRVCSWPSLRLCLLALSLRLVGTSRTLLGRRRIKSGGAGCGRRARPLAPPPAKVPALPSRLFASANK